MMAGRDEEVRAARAERVRLAVQRVTLAVERCLLGRERTTRQQVDAAAELRRREVANWLALRANDRRLAELSGGTAARREERRAP